MATVKVKFRQSQSVDAEGYIYYSIIHNRVVKQCVSSLRVRSGEWDGRRSALRFDADGPRRAYLLKVREKIGLDLTRFERVIGTLECSGGVYTADEIVARYHNYMLEASLFNYMRGIIGRLRANGRMRTSQTYETALRSFMLFRESAIGARATEADCDVMLDTIDCEMMEAYEAWHIRKGNCPNTVSFYTRILRAVYRRAVDEGLINDARPFRRVYTGVEKTVKRALPSGEINRLWSADLHKEPSLEFARDMFMMSFMLRGMSLVDMAFLRKSDLNAGYVTYRRRKTGRRLTIRWTEEMQRLLDKYPRNGSKYLLPIMEVEAKDEQRTFRKVANRINRGLRALGKRLDIAQRLTLYVARHSWASIARSKGVPLNVISEGMGHDNELTTQIYLAQLDSTAVDRANQMIISSI